ncbi:MAG: hypothetical protein QNK33_04580, partial [Bacteroidales bacterium]|nr:hypothetical protein [Bacteroidales bacterium]
RVVENCEKILGIELLCAAQALDYHRPLKSSKLMELLHNFLRENVPHIEEDIILSEQMNKAIELVKDGELSRLIRESGKDLDALAGTDYYETFETF